MVQVLIKEHGMSEYKSYSFYDRIDAIVALSNRERVHLNMYNKPIKYVII